MIEYEIIKHDRLSGIRAFLNTIRIRSLHMHQDIEIMLVTGGKGTIVVRNERYPVSAGDTVLINAWEAHEILAADDSLTVLIVQISNHFLREYCRILRNTVFLDVLPAKVLSPASLSRIKEDIYSLSNLYLRAEENFELACISHAADLLYLLYSGLHTEILSEEDYSKRRKNSRRMNRIADYISANCQSPIRLSDIAEHEGLTTTHLSHLISESLGMSFREYLRDKRLECSVQMIADPTMTLSDIAAASGFSELKYMTQAYRETFGMTPAEYRRNRNIPLPAGSRDNLSEYIYSPSEALEMLQRTKNN